MPYIWLAIEQSRHTPCAVVLNSVGVGTGSGLDRVDQNQKTMEDPEKEVWSRWVIGHPPMATKTL